MIRSSGSWFQGCSERVRVLHLAAMPLASDGGGILKRTLSDYSRDVIEYMGEGGP